MKFILPDADYFAKYGATAPKKKEKEEDSEEEKSKFAEIEKKKLQREKEQAKLPKGQRTLFEKGLNTFVKK